MKTDADCIFCKIVAGQIPCFKLYEDGETLAFMDINPVHDGHALVICKAHYPAVFDIDPEAFAAVSRAVVKVAGAVNKAVAPDGLNLVQSNGPGAAQSVPHFHVHVLPRKLGDELKVNWELKPGDRDRIAATAERIRAHL
jgi:histidine triad (HIT) family protein